MSKKFDDATVALAILAYPYYSNPYLAKYIGCSIVWLTKLKQKYNLKKCSDLYVCYKEEFQKYDLLNEKFGDLSVIEKLPYKIKNNIVWKCQCVCGNVFNVRSSLLRKDLITKCKKCVEKGKKKPKKESSWYFSKLKSHAFERGILFDIDIEYLRQLFKYQNGKCALSGIDLEFPVVKDNKRSGNGSLDRIDSNIGYIKGNVRWVAKHVNIMKNCYSDDFFIDVCCKIVDNYRNNNSIDLEKKDE